MENQDDAMARLFSRYATYVNAGLDEANIDQSDLFSLLYSDHAVISAIGRVTGINPDNVHDTLRAKLQRFRNVGAVRLVIKSLDFVELDAMHILCDVKWELECRLPDRRRKFVPYQATYIATLDGGEHPHLIAEMEGGLQVALIDSGLWHV